MRSYLHRMLMSLTLLLLTGCQLPMNQSTKSEMTQPNTQYWLQRDVNAEKKIAQGLTAFLPLHDPFLSIATRAYLIHQAKTHLDLQYYIWEDDVIGHHLLSDLLKAADRGVKVRLLIDDQNGTGLDETLSALAQHPNFEIKLFNPYKFRNFRVVDYLFRLKQVNHRMHNKLIIADGAVAVTGGRNISNEYFDASENFQFADMDIFFAGKSVESANQVFINFWNDEASFPVQQLIKNDHPELLVKLRDRYSKQSDFQNKKTQQKIAIAEKEIAEKIRNHPIRWSKAHFLADTPNKIRGNVQEQDLLYQQFVKVMGRPNTNMDLVSAYFVPTKKGLDYLTSLSQDKVSVRVLTNAYLSNDVPVVHAFYQKYREPLLKNGVKLFEFKPYIEREDRTWYEVMTGNVIPAKGKNASRLHAKFFDVDNKVFIGTFNFDPRSAHLNTELGLVVESESLREEISKSLDEHLPQVAYELKLNEKGKLIWLEKQSNGTVKQYDKDPNTTKFQRFMFKTIAYLPIEWMM